MNGIPMPVEFIAATQTNYNNYYNDCKAEHKYTMKASELFDRLPLNRFPKYVRMLLESRSQPVKTVLVHLDHEGFADSDKYKALVRLVPLDKIRVL
jgi:hypothetical protein